MDELKKPSSNKRHQVKGHEDAPEGGDGFSKQPHSPEKSKAHQGQAQGLTDIQQPQQRRRWTKPVCNHGHMVTIRTIDLTCHVCHEVPSLRFLYKCEEKPLIASTESEDGDTSLAVSHDPDHGFADLSEPIKRAIEQGCYTDEQIQVLIAQKQQVIRSIELAKTKVERKATLAKENRAKAEEFGDIDDIVERCDFMVCHRCRPLSRDRTYLNFDDVFSGRAHMPEELEPGSMFVMDKKIMKHIGLNQSPKQPDASKPDRDTRRRPRRSGKPCLHTVPSTIFEEDEDQDRPRETRGSRTRPTDTGEFVADLARRAGEFSEDDFRRSVRKSLVAMLDAAQRDTVTTLPDALAINIRRILARCERDRQFEAELFRTMMDRDLGTACHTPLPIDRPEDFPVAVDNLIPVSAEGSEGSEGVVHGIAVTEESLETRKPDIITSV